MNFFSQIINRPRALKYYLFLSIIFLALVFYFFFVIMSYIWPFLLVMLVVGAIYLYLQGKKNKVTYYK